MNQSALEIGVVAASADHLLELNRLVKNAGYAVTASLAMADLADDALPEVDAWVVSLDLNQRQCERVYEWLDGSGRPVIFAEDTDLYDYREITESAAAGDNLVLCGVREKRERRIADKLAQLVCSARIDDVEPARLRATKVWVLAASTGGPEAVAKFLDGLPDHLPGLALIYAQHIEASAVPNLGLVVRKHCSWRVEFTESAQQLRERTVYVLSPNHQVEVTETGILSPRFVAWNGRYRPCIDQVIAKVARTYKQNSGVIVFSGMGDDGADSSTLMHFRGGQVWIQTPESCAIDSMPVCVSKRGVVNVSAAPGELADKFVQYHLSH